WVFPSGPAGHQEIDSRMDLAAHQPAQSGFVQGVILAKRSDQRSPASCEHVEFPLCGVVPGRPSLDLGRQAQAYPNSLKISRNSKRPFFPTTQRAALSAPRAKPSRLRAVWRSAMVSAGESNPISDRKITRLNSSHLVISYAVFCLKKKKKI